MVLGIQKGRQPMPIHFTLIRINEVETHTLHKTKLSTMCNEQTFSFSFCLVSDFHITSLHRLLSPINLLIMWKALGLHCIVVFTKLLNYHIGFVFLFSRDNSVSCDHEVLLSSDHKPCQILSKKLSMLIAQYPF